MALIVTSRIIQVTHVPEEFEDRDEMIREGVDTENEAEVIAWYREQPWFIDAVMADSFERQFDHIIDIELED